MSSRAISGTEEAASPFWSPDSRTIGFSARGKLYRVELSGGSPAVVCNTQPIGGYWDRDGSILIGTVSSGLMRISVANGAMTPFTTPDASLKESAHRWPQILPHGRVLYWAQSLLTDESNGVYAARLDKPADRVRLLTTNSNAVYAAAPDGTEYLLWLRGDALIAQRFDSAGLKLFGEPQLIAQPMRTRFPLGLTNVSVSQNGLLLYEPFVEMAKGLVRYDRTGRVIGEAGEAVERVGPFRISPDGRLLAASRGEGGLWVTDLHRRVSSPFTHTTNPARDLYPIWSPDSRTLLFARIGGGIFRKDVNEGGSEKLTLQHASQPQLSDWSSDGRWVLYDAIGSDNRYDIWVVAVKANGEVVPDASPRPYLQTRFHERGGRFSPGVNPRWVAFGSDDSGQFEIYVTRFPDPSGKVQISTGGGTVPRWGPEGRELFYLGRDGDLMSVSLKMSGNSIEPSPPRALFRLSSPGTSWSFIEGGFEAAADGQSFVAQNRLETNQPHPLTVIVNWPALLKKGVPAP
jgi:dipeptidyl aminopeptidase/acylaminoacyl peptidase